MSHTITADDLETGDKLHDTEGHDQINHWGPDLTDDLVVKKRWERADHNRHDHDSWLLAPKVENGRISNESFVVSFETITERLENGRYQPVDLEVNKKLNADELPISTTDDVYIRFGDIPDNERSYNSADDRYEDGVSVYDAAVKSVPPESDEPAKFSPYGTKLLQVLYLIHRDTYLVAGDEVGTGVDGEPVLRNVEIIADLEYDSDVDGWVLAP